jgi:hypothetical protein
MNAMSVVDEVVCNYPLFGEHRGEIHQTHSLGPVFPDARYEITALGRLELLECTYKDRSDRSADGWARLAGAMTPVHTSERRDLYYHGWLDLPPLGRAKFTEGQLIAFEACPGRAGAEIIQSGEHMRIGGGEGDMRRSNSETRCVSAWTEIVFKGARQQKAREIPFCEELVKAGRILDDATEREWVDDAERRLWKVLSRPHPQPTLLGYVAERLVDGLELYTVTPSQIDKPVFALLCAGQWPAGTISSRPFRNSAIRT